MKRGHINTRTWQLIDQLGQVGENKKQSKKKKRTNLRKSFKLIKKIKKKKIQNLYIFSPKKEKKLFSLSFANQQD